MKKFRFGIKKINNKRKSKRSKDKRIKYDVEGRKIKSIRYFTKNMQLDLSFKMQRKEFHLFVSILY